MISRENIGIRDQSWNKTLNWIVLILDIIDLPETTGYYISCFITF